MLYYNLGSLVTHLPSLVHHARIILDPWLINVKTLPDKKDFMKCLDYASWHSRPARYHTLSNSCLNKTTHTGTVIKHLHYNIAPCQNLNVPSLTEIALSPLLLVKLKLLALNTRMQLVFVNYIWLCHADDRVTGMRLIWLEVAALD